MHRVTFISLACCAAPLVLGAQQTPPGGPPAAPHDSVRGAIRAVDVRARTVEVKAGVGFALRIVQLQVPAGVPITDREDGEGERIGLGELRPGDVIRAVFGGTPTRYVAYVIERVGRMETGVEGNP